MINAGGYGFDSMVSYRHGAVTAPQVLRQRLDAIIYAYFRILRLFAAFLPSTITLPNLSTLQVLHLTDMFFTPELLSRRDSGFGLLWYVPKSTHETSN